MIRKKVKMLGLGIAAMLLFSACTAEKSLREYDKGVLAYKEGRFEEAAGYFEAALEKNPDKAEYYLYYGYALMELGQYENAQKQFEQAMLDKEMESIRNNTKQAYRAAGIAAYYRQDWQQAMIYLKLAYQMEELPELNEDILAYTQQIAWMRIADYLAAENYAAAEELCTEIEESYGANAALWMIRGNIAYTRGEALKTAECYEQAMLSGEDTVTVRIAVIANYLEAVRGEMLTAEEKEIVLQKLADAVEELEEKQPKEQEQRELGCLFYAVQEYEQAKRWLCAAQALGQEDAQMTYLLSQIAIAEADYEEALRLLQQKAEAELSENDYYQMAFCAAVTGQQELAWSYQTTGKQLCDEAEQQRWDRLSIYLREQEANYDEAHEELEAYVKSYLTPEALEWEAMQKELAYLEYRSR